MLNRTKVTIYRIWAILLILQMAYLFAGDRELGFGCLRETEIPDWVTPSPPVQLRGEYRESVDLSDNFPPILSQGGQGSCTAWASAYYYKTYQEWLEHQWDLEDMAHRFSPAFVYNQINGGSDSGSNLSDAFLVFASMGCTSWENMPYNDDICTEYPDEEDYLSGIDYRTEETFAIDIYADFQSVKNLLSNGEAVPLSISIYEHFNSIDDWDHVYGLNSLSGNYVAGHSVTACGFDDDKITPDGMGAMKFANSWGSGWGENGYFWISYEALQSPTITHQFAYYATDRIAYEPELITRFHVSHEIRGAVGFRFGIGETDDPLWSVPALNWSNKGNTVPIGFPASNIVFDLTDGMDFFEPEGISNMFMRTKDERFYWHRDTEHAFEGQSWWCANPEIPGYDNGWLMDLELPSIQLSGSDNLFLFMMSYAIEEPSDYGEFDGWDVANVAISTNAGETWEIIDGSLPYNVSNSWAYDFHEIGSGFPGWGGYSPDWQEVIFDLDNWADETVNLKITFISDAGWCSRDDEAFFGLAVDNLQVLADGVEVYFDDAELSRTEGIIDYFAVEYLPAELYQEATDTPIIIPEGDEYVYSQLAFVSNILPGDLNNDMVQNVLDIVLLVDIIMDSSTPPTDLELTIADLNSDGELDILDVIILIGIIVEG